MNTLQEEQEEEFAKHLGEYENHHRLHGESFYEWAITFIHRINEAQRTADLEALREGVEKLQDEGLVEIISPDLSKFRHQAIGYQQACSDTLSLIEQIKNKKI